MLWRCAFSRRSIISSNFSTGSCHLHNERSYKKKTHSHSQYNSKNTARRWKHIWGENPPIKIRTENETNFDSAAESWFTMESHCSSSESISYSGFFSSNENATTCGVKGVDQPCTRGREREKKGRNLEWVRERERERERERVCVCVCVYVWLTIYAYIGFRHFESLVIHKLFFSEFDIRWKKLSRWRIRSKKERGIERWIDK